MERRTLGQAALGALAAAVMMLALSGYTVDDALITARVATRLAHGEGYRFNTGGPRVDAVTPLGYANLLALVAGATPLETLARARLLGALAWLLAAAGLGVGLARVGRGSAEPGALRFAPLLALALSAPLGAWAVSGMETGWVTALATAALLPGSGGWLAAGLAAAWRPELLPWALTLAVGSALVARAPPARVLAAASLALAPALAVAGVRAALFGSPAPLAALAKPADLEHGLRYALGALALTGPPWLVLAPRGLARLAPRLRVVVAAAGAHFAALALAGGDWMALYRLAVPVLPGLLLVGAALARVTPWWATALRLAATLAVEGLVLIGLGPSAARVTERRAALIASARPVLAGARRVAAVDVGWVGAATPTDVVDLAGVTDREVARLPGGHTSKRLPERFLEARGVDALVLLIAPGEPLREPWWTSRFAPYAVDARVAALAADAGFRAVATLPLPGTRQRYLIARRASP